MPRHRWPTDQFEMALDKIRLTKTNRTVLQAFLDAPLYTLTAHTLEERAALSGGWSAANLRMGELARKFQPYLGTLEPEEDDEPHWWRYISTGHWQNGRFHWTLRPELREALLRSGWTTRLSALTPEELPDEVEAELIEGAVQRVTVNAYERNREARRICLEQHGHACMACGTLLEAIYGEAATDLIHVHHQRPLASIGQAYRVDGREDLIPVCPNCHAVMHRREPPYSVVEIRQMLKQQRAR